MTKDFTFKNIKYALHFPDNYDESEKYPLIIYLHGSGTRGDDIELVIKNSSFNKLCEYKNNDCIVAAPLCSAVNWNELMSTLIDFCDMLRSLDYVDASRVYLTGKSMGGYGTWELASLRPWFFAAVMPLCGGGIAWHAYRLKAVPVYAYHGILDRDVMPDESLKMARAVNLAGGHAELTIYSDLGHNCWDRVYGDSANLDKLFEHSSSGKIPDFTEFTGENYG